MEQAESWMMSSRSHMAVRIFYPSRTRLLPSEATMTAKPHAPKMQIVLLRSFSLLLGNHALRYFYNNAKKHLNSLPRRVPHY
jgi:hypothetical protein